MAGLTAADVPPVDTRNVALDEMSGIRRVAAAPVRRHARSWGFPSARLGGAVTYWAQSQCMPYARPRVIQDEARRRLQDVFDSLFLEGEVTKALDAGCGYKLPLDFHRDVHLVGLDATPEAIAKNENIDEAIVGDLQTYPLPQCSFDAVICWWVLEHVPDVKAAFRNMARSLRANGVLVIGVPRLWSMKGLVTKVTPYEFHIWVYRQVFNVANAGEPGVAPFRTYLSRDISPRGLLKLAAEEGLYPVYASSHGELPSALPRFLRAMLSISGWIGKRVTVGHWDPLASEYVVIFRKATTR
jgi:SAM-dependent methyltransferase